MHDLRPASRNHLSIYVSLTFGGQDDVDKMPFTSSLSLCTYHIEFRTSVDRYQNGSLRLLTPAPIEILVKPLPRSVPPLHAIETPDAVDYAGNAML